MPCPPCFIPGLAFWQAVSAKKFCIFSGRLHADGVMQPLALVFYEKLMPGSQLVNKLQDLNYRVQTVNDPALLQPGAPRESPLLVIADLAGGEAVCSRHCRVEGGCRHRPHSGHRVCRRGRDAGDGCCAAGGGKPRGEWCPPLRIICRSCWTRRCKSSDGCAPPAERRPPARRVGFFRKRAGFRDRRSIRGFSFARRERARYFCAMTDSKATRRREPLRSRPVLRAEMRVLRVLFRGVVRRTHQPLCRRARARTGNRRRRPQAQNHFLRRRHAIAS